MTKETLYNDLLNSGLKSTDTVLIHSSLRQIGNICALDVLDVLIDFFKDGLLLFPTHTWAYIKNPYDTFDVLNSKPNVGILPTLFLKRKGVIRSLHPTHSMAGLGYDALEYLKGEEVKETPCDPLGVYGRLYDRKAKILLIGVDHVKNTYIHSVEESFKVENRIASVATPFYVIDEAHHTKEVKMHKHYCTLHPHVSECYQKLDPIFFALGAENITKFGDAVMRVCDCQKIYNILALIFSHQKQILVEEESINPSFYLDI